MKEKGWAIMDFWVGRHVKCNEILSQQNQCKDKVPFGFCSGGGHALYVYSSHASWIFCMVKWMSQLCIYSQKSLEALYQKKKKKKSLRAFLLLSKLKFKLLHNYLHECLICKIILEIMENELKTNFIFRCCQKK